MARMVSNAFNSRSSREKLKLAPRRDPYWTVISQGCAIGYRVGIKGATWIARYRDNAGNQHYQALGAADDILDADNLSVFNFGQAQVKAREWFDRKVREQAGDFIAPDRPYTVTDALADYLTDYERRSGKATDNVKWATAALIEPELGTIPLDKLNKRQIVAWHEKIAATPPRVRTKRGEVQKHRGRDDSEEGIRRRRSTANRVLTILKAALNLAHREGKCAIDDAWRTIHGYREVDVARLRYLSDDEARRLTNACQSDFRQLVVAALMTGCRYGELCAMIVEDFNTDAGTVWVRKSKSGKPRHVVLSQEGIDFFNAVASGKPKTARMLLHNSGETWNASNQQRPLMSACIAAEIDPPISFHVLRHTYASRLAMRNISLQVIAKQLGHTDTRMVEKHYGHLAPSYISDTIRNGFGTLGIVPT